MIRQKLIDNAHLKHVKLPSDLVSIGVGAFACCYALDCDLSECTVLEKIGTNAFAYAGLTDVVITENVAVLGENAFYRCKQLASVTFKGATIYIDEEAFNQADGLKTITFEAGGEGLSFHQGALRNALYLDKIVFSGTTDEWSAIVKEYRSTFVSPTLTITVECNNGTIVMIGGELQ